MKTLWFAILVCALALCGCRRKAAEAEQELYTVKRGPLEISILTSGSVETASPLNIMQKIGRTAKIVSIIPEGTMITQADIAAKRVLVQFDSKDVEDTLFERQTAYENAVASEVSAEETLAIQISDNENNIRKAELEVIYAENDLRKLVGEVLAAQFMEKEPADIAAILTDKRLDGSALQNLNTYRSDIELAQTKLNRAQQKLEYTKKLFDLQFVSKNEYENDLLDVQSQKKSLDATQGKYDIFVRFDFVKDFQKTWATWQEAKVALKRAKATAKIRLTTAESRYRNAKQALTQATNRLEQAKEAVANCTIYATVPGMVVYAAVPRWDNTGPIQPGKEIRNQQMIFSLPDLDHMQVKVSIIEAQIDAIKVGQGAVIKVDAMQGRSFTGKVASRSILPSAENTWLNPDLKVYDVKVDFSEAEHDLRPGMTATVEITIARLENVLFVPIQAVLTDSTNRHWCVLADGTRRPVRLGERSRSFVVVEAGLSEGDRVQMAPQERDAKQDDQEEEKKDGEKGKPAPKPEEAPA